jgi:hypothetical protein
MTAAFTGGVFGCDLRFMCLGLIPRSLFRFGGVQERLNVAIFYRNRGIKPLLPPVVDALSVRRAKREAGPDGAPRESEREREREEATGGAKEREGKAESGAPSPITSAAMGK